MKIRYQILIILLIIFTLFFFARKDVLSVLNNIFPNLNNKETETEIINLGKQKEVILPNKEETPGPLKITGDFFDKNNNIKLSKDNVIKITNQYRKENGNLEALKKNQKLNISASLKLKDMFDNQYFEHISPKGIGVGEVSSQAGYEYIIIGENLAMGNFKSDLALVDAWMASPGHKKNILNKNYTEIGVAVGKGQFDGKNVWMAVQHFGTPLEACPGADQVLHGIINLNQKKIQEMEKDLSFRRDKIDKRVLYEGSTYYEQIDIYNNLVNIYNNLLIETKQKIDIYNNQVQVFNLCLANHQ